MLNMDTAIDQFFSMLHGCLFVVECHLNTAIRARVGYILGVDFFGVGSVAVAAVREFHGVASYDMQRKYEARSFRVLGLLLPSPFGDERF